MNIVYFIHNGVVVEGEHLTTDIMGNTKIKTAEGVISVHGAQLYLSPDLTSRADHIVRRDGSGYDVAPKGFEADFIRFGQSATGKVRVYKMWRRYMQGYSCGLYAPFEGEGFARDQKFVSFIKVADYGEWTDRIIANDVSAEKCVEELLQHGLRRGIVPADELYPTLEALKGVEDVGYKRLDGSWSNGTPKPESVLSLNSEQKEHLSDLRSVMESCVMAGVSLIWDEESGLLRAYNVRARQGYAAACIYRDDCEQGERAVMPEEFELVSAGIDRMCYDDVIVIRKA